MLAGLALAVASPVLAENPYRLLVVGDSISVGYTDNPTWSVPYQFGFRSDLYTRLANSGFAVQLVGGSPEPWDGKFGIPANTPPLDLRPLNQDRCEAYGGQGTSYILANIASWLALDAPDIILLMANINDIAKGSTAEPIAAEQTLSNIVFTITRSAPNARLIVAQITPYSSYTLGIVKYNTYIRNVLVPCFAAQGKFVTSVNQYTNLCAAGTTNIATSLFSNGINHPSAAAYARMAETWLAGIQALTLPPPQTPPQRANLLINGGFETPAFAHNTHNINPAGSGWTFTVGATGAGSGIDRGDAYGSSGSWPIDGAQQAFLQSSGNSTTTRLARAVSGLVVGRYYQVSFHAKGITGFQAANPFQVRLLDGGTVTPLFGGTLIAPTVTNYTLYQSEPFRATSPTMTLEFADNGLATVQKVSWIDAVALFTAQTAVRFEFDFATGAHGFVGGFADYPTNYNPASYLLTADHRPRPANLGGAPALFISGDNHSDDLFMFWKKKLTGLPPSTSVLLTMELEFASKDRTGLFGIGGSPGDGVYLKTGATSFEPMAVVQSGYFHMNLDKGNQAVGGQNMPVRRTIAKPDDGNDDYVLLPCHHHGTPQTVTTAADGSLWIVFGTDSGFEGETALYYTRVTVWLNRADTPQLWIEPASSPGFLQLVWNQGSLRTSDDLGSAWQPVTVTQRPHVHPVASDRRRFWKLVVP